MSLARFMLATLVSVSLLTTACATDEPEPGDQEAFVGELDMPSWQTEEPGVRDWWGELIEEYEKQHPDIRINFNQVPFDAYLDTLTTRFAAGDPPDILHLVSWNFPQFAGEGWLEGIDDRLAQTDILDNWTSLQEEEMVWEGENQGVLLLAYGYLLWYNEQLLQQAGVDVPATPEEFMAAVEAFTGEEQFGFGAVTTSSPTVASEMGMFVTGTGSSLVSDGQWTLDDPAVIDAVEMYRQTAVASPQGLDSGQRRQLFLNGKVAMFFDGPFILPLLDEEAPEDVRPHLKVARLPFPVVPGTVSNSLHIPAGLDEARQDAVWDFIELAASPEWQRRYVELYNVPAAREGTLSEEVLAEIPELEVMVESANEAVSIRPSDDQLRAIYGEAEKLMIDAMMRLMTGDEPTPAVLSDLQEQLSDLTQ
jgi:multiple sugar transport system substrate-binding protein